MTYEIPNQGRRELQMTAANTATWNALLEETKYDQDYDVAAFSEGGSEVEPTPPASEEECDEHHVQIYFYNESTQQYELVFDEYIPVCFY